MREMINNPKDVEPYLITTDDLITDCNNEFYNLTGYSKAETINKDINEVLKEQLRLTTSDIFISSNLRSTQGFIFTKSLVAREVDILVVSGTTEHEKIYLFIEKPNSRLETKFPMAESICSQNIGVGVGILCIHPHIILLKANQILLNFFEQPFNSREHSISKSLDELVTCWHGSVLESELKNACTSGKTLLPDVYCHERLDGEKTYWQPTIIPVSENSKIKYVIILEADITESILNKKRVEQQAKVITRQKEQFEAVIKSMSDGLELIDNKFNITYLNQSAKDFFYKPEERSHVGDSLKYSRYLYGIDGEEIPFEDLPPFKVFNTGSVQNNIITFVHPDKKIYASINGSPIYDDDGTISQVILCIRDITEQVKKDKMVALHQESVLHAEYEKNRALTNAIEMKDEFLSLISHEFKTPLTVINSAIQAMELICKNELSPKAKGFIKKIKQNSYRQLRLVNNLLDITRINAGHIKLNKKNLDIIFLTKAITESVHLYASQKGIALSFISDINRKVIGIDEEKYERILLNLLSNAIKFTPEGKSITVSVSRKENNLCIQVKDTGPGIPLDKQKLIFDKFGQVESSLTRQAEGTGIGLSLVKMFVEALGGRISLKSNIGEGSTFTILLPDSKVQEDMDTALHELTDNRLIQSIAVEFSDIYLDDLDSDDIETDFLHKL